MLMCDPKPKDDHLELAMTYAWNWFEYHAGQRLSVFRFFLIVVAFMSTGYVTSIVRGESTVAAGLALTLGVTTFFFSRLDVRSMRLIKVSEAPLKKLEEKLSTLVECKELKLAFAADEKPDFTKTWWGKHVIQYCYSFRQIYNCLFVIIGIVAVCGFLFSLIYEAPINPYATTSPVCDVVRAPCL